MNTKFAIDPFPCSNPTDGRYLLARPRVPAGGPGPTFTSRLVPPLTDRDVNHRGSD
jgi:hypothetical protein